VGRVTGSRSALTSVAALLYRPVTLEGENLELILRAKDRAFSLAANREVREKARLGRNMLTFSSRAVEPPRAIVFFLFSTCAIVVVAASPTSSSESSSFVRFLTLPRPNFPFFLKPPNPPALSEDAGGEETSAHDSMEREDIARRAAGNETYPGVCASVLVASGVLSSSPMTRTAPCAVYSGSLGDMEKNELVFVWDDTSFARRTHSTCVKRKMASNSGVRLLTLRSRARSTFMGSLSQSSHSQLAASGRLHEADVSRCVAHRFTTSAKAWMANGGEASGPGPLIEQMKAKVSMRYHINWAEPVLLSLTAP